MEAPRRMQRTNRFRSHRSGREEENVIPPIVVPVIRFKIDGKMMPCAAPEHPRVAAAARWRPAMRRRRPRRPRTFFRYNRRYRRTYRSRPQAHWEAMEWDVEEACFRCCSRKSGKSGNGKMRSPHGRGPWHVRLSKRSQSKKHKHKKSWKRRGQDIDFGW